MTTPQPTTTSNKPAATVRDGAVKATVWANPTDDGRVRYSVDISRSYTDNDGNWHDTHYFGRNELLRVARIAAKAYDAIDQMASAEPKQQAAA